MCEGWNIIWMFAIWCLQLRESLKKKMHYLVEGCLVFWGWDVDSNVGIDLLVMHVSQFCVNAGGPMWRIFGADVWCQKSWCLMFKQTHQGEKPFFYFSWNSNGRRPTSRHQNDLVGSKTWERNCREW